MSLWHVHMRLLAQPAIQRVSVCIHFCYYLCWNFVSCVMSVFLCCWNVGLHWKLKQGAAETEVCDSYFDLSPWQKVCPHFHRCLHKYNRLAIFRLPPGSSMYEPEQGSATRAVECTNITSFVNSVSCDVMQSREQWNRKCVCNVCRLCFVHNCEQNVLQFGMQRFANCLLCHFTYFIGIRCYRCRSEERKTNEMQQLDVYY